MYENTSFDACILRDCSVFLVDFLYDHCFDMRYSTPCLYGDGAMLRK
jgi:hypothetical protein